MTAPDKPSEVLVEGDMASSEALRQSVIRPAPDLAALLARLETAVRPDARLDGELDALVGHENEQWPPPYTSEVIYLQQITPRLGLDVHEVSQAALRELTPSGPVAITYGRALIRALIARDGAQDASALGNSGTDKTTGTQP